MYQALSPPPPPLEGPGYEARGIPGTRLASVYWLCLIRLEVAG